LLVVLLTRSPVILAVVITAELLIAAYSFITLSSLARVALLPMGLLVLPMWGMARLLHAVDDAGAITGILRTGSCILTGAVFLHSVGLRNVRMLLEQLRLPADFVLAWQIMLAQATSFGGLLEEMGRARAMRRIAKANGREMRQEIGSQLAVLLARMLRRGDDLGSAMQTRNISAQKAIQDPPNHETRLPESGHGSDGKPLFFLQNVSHQFGPEGLALDDVTLQIPAAGCVALLGANGAGKSTLLHLIAGVISPTSGELQWRGQPYSRAILEKDLNLRREFRRQVGMVFQDPDCQWLCETVREEVEYGPRQIWPAAEARERADQMMVLMGINHLADRAPYSLSGGQKRRVALASVMSLDPDVLLLDEPTLSLDAATTDFLVDWLVEFLARPGKTVILATHDLCLALEVGTWCAVLTPCHRLARTGRVAEIAGDKLFLQQMNLASRRGRTDCCQTA